MITTVLKNKGKYILHLDGVAFLVDSNNNVEFNPGDTYIAEKNMGPQLLTVQSVDKRLNCIYPVENAYPYDITNCVKVVKML